MRLVRRALLALACTFAAIPFISAGVASAAPVDGSGCTSWVRLVDLSSYQNSIDWSQVARAGVAGVYIKVSEGNWYVNPLFGSQKAGAAANGLPWGGYDFAQPGKVDPVVDAQYFVANGGAAGTLPPVLDLEVSNLNAQYTVVWAAFWAAEVKTLTGKTSTIYTGAYYPWSGDLNLANIGPLWLSAYTSGYNHVLGDSACNTSQPSASGAWGGWSMWQFTSVGQIYGIGGNVDVSAVTPQWWAAATGAAVAAPQAGTNNYPAPVYSVASTGTKVIDIQNAMNFWEHAGLTVDGNYGPATTTAVARFQANVLHVTADGVWGPATNTAYNAFVAAMAKFAANAPAPAPSIDWAGIAAFVNACKASVLQQGASGVCVSLLQQDLQARGFPIAKDGAFGAATRSAIVSFQSLHGLVPDGIVGRATWGVLMP
jgi:GH25 family lysozyme M1 (1,4-beta-N-acetylmuramidase)/peptidoglycan hydrolase-like protein with peptidoglycan-binding domain